MHGNLHGVLPLTLSLSRALSLRRFNVMVYAAIFTVVILVGLDTYVDNPNPNPSPSPSPNPNPNPNPNITLT